MLKARAGARRDVVRDAGAGFPPNVSIPRARPSERRPGGGLHRARGPGDAAGRRRGAPLEPGMFARVGPNESREAITDDEPALILALGGVPGGVSLSRTSPRRAAGPARRGRRSRGRRTVKRIEDFEAIFGGGFRRARAGLGVTSFGIAVIDLPPRFHGLPRPRPGPRPPGGGLHPAQRPGDRSCRRQRGSEHHLEPGVWIRVGPDELRKIITGDEPARVLAIGGTPGDALRPPEFTEEGAAAPPMIDKEHAAEPSVSGCGATSGTDPRRRALEGRRGAGSVVLGRQRQAPRIRTAGIARPCSRARSAAAASSSATAIAVAASLSPRASRRPRQSSRATSPAQPIATSACPTRHGRPKLSATTTAGPRRRQRRAAARIMRAEASGSSGSRPTRPAPGTFEASIPAFAQTQPPRSRRSAPRARRGPPGATREHQLDKARVLAELAASSSARSPGRPRPAPDPSLRLRDHLLRDGDDVAVVGLEPRPPAVAAISAPRRRPADLG